MNVTGERLEPFHFGPPDTPLFGLFHAPAESPSRECCMVVCPPMGHEYVQFHRALRILAERLSGAGFPVLRFDYYGCGDSSGDAYACTVERWLEDTAAAAAEAVRRSGRRRVCLVGQRLGASLACLAGAEIAEAEGLVLWDAVQDGRRYLAELQHMHREMMLTAHVLEDRGRRTPGHAEALGFPLPDALLAGLGQVDLMSLPRRPARRTLVIETNSESRAHGLAGRLQTLGAAVESRTVQVGGPWRWVENFGKVPVPLPVITSIVQWAAETCP